MKTQICIIHGGNSYNSYEEYLEGLAKKQVRLEWLQGRNWKKSLGMDLGDVYSVYNLQMPCMENAKHVEWKIWFEKYVPYFEDGIILIGHSLGGIFLAKYLSENTFPKNIAAVFLVAAPYNTPTEHPRADFNILTPLSKFEEQAQSIYLYHSKDDLVVPFSNFENYRASLPTAQTRIFEDRGHFNAESLPELLADVRNLGK